MQPMIYSDFHGEKLSMLGFGAMRLPLKPGGQPTDIDEAQVASMVACAMAHGVNYFDTAYPYHGGRSEVVLGNALKIYPRNSYYLADKFPGHQIAQTYDPKAVFEEQLKKCGVDYFDFYLLHNIYENSIKTYTDPKWGIIDYFVEQKKQGKIRYLGCSAHGGLDVLRSFFDRYADIIDFCQIQLNYIDWTLQDAEAKVKLLDEYNIPVWVMEPVRGGKLASLPEEVEQRLKMLRPDESIAAWAFRWLQGIPSVKVVLSGMSSYAQMIDNVNTFDTRKPTTESENAYLMAIAEQLKQAVPCTQCRYCCDGCPKGLDIPKLIGIYNELRFSPSVNASMRIEAMPEDKKPSACVGCGRCETICPQRIRIPEIMRELDGLMKTMPSWAETSRIRAEAARKLKTGKIG